MNKYRYIKFVGNTIFIFLICCLILPGWFSLSAKAADERRSVPEYQIKAVYLYNFILFTKWPESRKSSRDNQRSSNSGFKEDESDFPEKHSIITIGIVGDDPFGAYFEEVEGKHIKLREKIRILFIKRFGPFKKDIDLRQCQLLFISSSEKNNLKEILADVKGTSILTVSDIDGFLEMGGMLNLIKVKGNIRWEINQSPIEQAGLSLSSQLLRNALRVDRF